MLGPPHGSVLEPCSVAGLPSLLHSVALFRTKDCCKLPSTLSALPQALADLGLQGAFDAVYGSSAGAINSTFFLAGKDWQQSLPAYVSSAHVLAICSACFARLIPGLSAPALILSFRLIPWLPPALPAPGQRTGVQIYHDHIACPEFIDLRRLWSRQSGEGPVKPVLDLSFLIDHVMHSVHPLDWDAVLESPLPLKVG